MTGDTTGPAALPELCIEMPPHPVLHTARLLLRPFEPPDAPAVETLAGAFEIADATLTVPHPYPPGAAVEWIASHAARWETGAGVTFAIVEREEGAVVGAIGLAIVPKYRHAELGYWVGVPFWNRGYCTEAGRAVLECGFRELGLHRIHARHLTRNPASGRVMQKLGMQLEGIQRGGTLKWGKFEDLAMYAILEPEWTSPPAAAPG